MFAQQILDEPDAAAYLGWLDWAYWLVLVVCIGAVIIGGAAAWRTENVESGRWGRTMIIAGLAGALAATFIDQAIGLELPAHRRMTTPRVPAAHASLPGRLGDGRPPPSPKPAPSCACWGVGNRAALGTLPKMPPWGPASRPGQPPASSVLATGPSMRSWAGWRS